MYESELTKMRLFDTHIHFLEGGFRLASVQLRDARTPEEFAARIQALATTVPPGTWIGGGDWDHERWGGELPRRDWIDVHTPEHPVWVNSLDGHMALANSAALRAAGLDRDAEDVAGGTIAGRSTMQIPTAGFRRRESRWRKHSARTRSRRRLHHSKRS